MGNSDAMFRQLLSDLHMRLNTHVRTPEEIGRSGEDPLLLQLPAGPAEPPVFQIPDHEPKYRKDPDGTYRDVLARDVLPPKPPPDEHLSRSGGFAPNEPTRDEILAYRDKLDEANIAMRQSQLSPFQLQRQDMRQKMQQYRFAEPELDPAEREARNQQKLKAFMQQRSSASGGYAPPEPAPPPDWKARLDDLQRRAQALKGTVQAPAGMKKPPKGDLI